RIAARTGPLLRRHDPDPRGDPRDRGRPHGPRGQPAQACAAHRRAGQREPMDPRLPARAGGLPAALAQAAEVLAAGGPRGQRLRRQERVLQLHPGRSLRRRDRGLQRTRRVLTRPAVASPGPIWIRLGPLPSFLGRKPMIASKSCKARVLCLAIAAVLAMPAKAQEAGTSSGNKDNDDQVKTLDRLTATGSRINRIEVEQALPITTVTREEIDQQGITSAEQLLMVLNVAGNGSDNLVSNSGIVHEDQRGNNGVSGANLRGQGADATLVLLNGRRVATHGLKGRAVDLNAIPFAAIERVEVLRDGASAVYGTDAIGGVINFITRRDFQGAQVTGFVDVTEAGGGNIHRGSILFGHGDLDGDGWNAFGTLSVKRNTILRGDDRDFSNAFQPDRGLSPDTRGTPFATVFNRTGTQADINLI